MNEKKRLVACSDGTWNSPDKETHTNVELFYHSIVETCERGRKQLKFYDGGVGTLGSKSEQVYDGITGEGIDENIKDVYRFLMGNYVPGDEIFLYGFSRGAYTARSVAGLIRNCGLLKPEYMDKIDEVYELYRSRDTSNHPESEYMKTFRQKFCIEEETSVFFIGVWDTVGSLGLPWRKKYNASRYQFHDVKVSSKIRYAYHAISIDECRTEFAPTLWELSDSVKNTSEHKQVLEQRWFAGVHSNVGGGYTDTGLSDLALAWLLQKGTEAGLSTKLTNLSTISPFDKTYKHNPSYSGKLYNSMKWYYWITFSFTRRQVLGARINERGEQMVTNEFIDDSVWQRIDDPKCRYNPKNMREHIAARKK